jgi:hypothetical protein
MSESDVHRCLLSESNTGSVIPLCECAWIGSIHVPPTFQQGKGGKMIPDVDAAQRSAKREWEGHARAVLGTSSADERTS